MNKKRLEVRLPEDNPIWTVPKGTRAEIVNKALLMYFGRLLDQGQHKDSAEAEGTNIEYIKAIAEELRRIRLVLEKGQSSASEEQPVEEPKEQKPSVAEHLRKMIQEIWDTDEEGTS